MWFGKSSLGLCRQQRRDPTSGAAAALVRLWIYYTSQILLFGPELGAPAPGASSGGKRLTK